MSRLQAFLGWDNLSDTATSITTHFHIMKCSLDSELRAEVARIAEDWTKAHLRDYFLDQRVRLVITDDLIIGPSFQIRGYSELNAATSEVESLGQNAYTFIRIYGVKGQDVSYAP